MNNMREIKIGNKEIRVRATPLTLLFYKKEFKKDMLADMIKLSEVAEDPTQFDGLLLMQITWAMAKTNKFGKDFPSFEKWLSELEYADFGDVDMLMKISEVAEEGLFRSQGKDTGEKQ